MSHLPRLAAALLCAAVLAAPATGDDETKTVEQIVKENRGSVVVITAQGRDGQREGLGTGFVVSADGLIATNLHVIGEGRLLRVETADGKRLEVTEVHATDRDNDLAVIRVKAEGLRPVPLGESGSLADGQAVVALGNPLGLKHSVVAGVVSGTREIDGRPMIQLAIPLERGNSGGPLLDMRGRAVGVLTLKSLVTANLGFAAGIDALKPLLEKPNPVRMDRWLTIGALDPEEWQPLFGARWTQRAGRLRVEGAGRGFGGRSLCLWQGKVPDEPPYELAVTVKLDDERGAAGLLFHGDAEHRHYGFYPTGGRLRLTRFDGPDVLSWEILANVDSPHYRPGDWNTIKVRLEKTGIRCYVNGHLVIESGDTARTSGAVGLAKFRDTRAEFKQFRVARSIPSDTVPGEVEKRILDALGGLDARKPAPSEVVESLSGEGAAGPRVLREEARRLEERAERLRALAARVHQRRVLGELAKAAEGPDDRIDLTRAALLVAKLDNEDLDVDAYRAEVDRMARKLKAALPNGAGEAAKRAALNRFLFEERAFHGSRGDYYTRSNSYLNEVIDDREGIPITLSVLYAELGRRIGLKIEGIGLPGHFIVRHVPAEGEGVFIDVYERGKELSREEVDEIVRTRAGREPTDDDLKPVTKRAILVRMLRNLLRLAQQEQDVEGGLRYLDAIVLLDPDAAPDRFMRAGLRYFKGMHAEAMEDVEWLLEHPSPGVDDRRVRQLRELLLRGADAPAKR